MRLITWIGLVMAAVLVSACSMGDAPGVPKDAEAEAIKTFDQVRAGDTAALKARGTREMQGPEVEAAVAQLRTLIPKGEPTKTRTLRWQISMSSGQQALIVREHAYPDHVLVASTTLFRPDDKARWKVQGFNVHVATRAELEANSFTLTGRSPVHYLFLAGAVISPLICLFGLITVLRAPKFRWKWAFAILSLLAFVQFTLNWTTGAWSVTPIAFLLLGAGFVSGGSAFDPWMLSFALPIGAAIAIWRAGKARRDARKARVSLFDEPRTEPEGS